MTAFMGADPNGTYTATELQQAGRGFGLGDRFVDAAGKEYIFTVTTGAVSAARAVLFANDMSSCAHLTNAQNNSGGKVGIAVVDVASGSYGWFQIFGACNIRVAASCVGGAKLYTSATAGVLDDTATSQDEVLGVTLTTTIGGAEATAAGTVSYPIVSITT
jgi:hypothetical protein